MATEVRSRVAECIVCSSLVRRFTPSAVTFCRGCGDAAWMARRDLEREGALPKHGRDLRGIYTHDLVIERARQIAAGQTTPIVVRLKKAS